MDSVNFRYTDSLTDGELTLIRNQWDELDKKDDQRLVGLDWESRNVYQVIEVADKFAGYTHVVTKAGVGELRSILVFEAYRGQGLGEQLLSKTMEYLKANKVHKITKITRTIYPDYKMLLSAGFSEITVLPNHFGGEEYVLLSKLLV